MTAEKIGKWNRRYLRAFAILFVTVLAFGLLINAPPVIKAATIDLDNYRITFDDEFENLDVSARGPGTRWIAHTPWSGDFGEAEFVDPTPGFPFTISNGVLRIEARKDADGKWRSGLLASVDANNRGFGQRYGYFEIRAKLPAGLGLWPAFWLDSLVLPPLNDPSTEIDVLEHHGHFPGAYESIVTVWSKTAPNESHSERHVNSVPSGTLYEEFHTYGVSVEPDWTVFYLDRSEIWRVKTPPEHRHKLMILLNLALGSGWPIEKTPSPSFMYVDYVRAYERR
jgi:beta-glucanase (GH16 family)